MLAPHSVPAREQPLIPARAKITASKRHKPRAFVLSVHKLVSGPLKGGTGCRCCTEGASLLSLFILFFLFYFFKNSSPSLSPPLPLSQTSPEILFLSDSKAPLSFHENTTKTPEIPHQNIPSKAVSLSPSSRQVLNISHKKATKIPKPNANQSESAV